MFTDTSENNIELLFYEYGLEKVVFDSIRDRILSLGFAAKYNRADTCLLIVNRDQADPFEEQVKQTEPLVNYKVDDICYEGKYPIPNFIGNNLQEQVVKSYRICREFEIVVLGAGRNYNFKNFLLKKNNNMPEFWSNGYSYGVGYNNESRTLIYWGIIW